MRVIEHFNQTGDSRCPICETNEDKETVLISIYGTKDGNIYEGKQTHLECLDLFYYPQLKVIAMKTEKDEVAR